MENNFFLKMSILHGQKVTNNKVFKSKSSIEKF